MTIGKNHIDIAMFIVLEPGIGYEKGTDPYVKTTAIGTVSLAFVPEGTRVLHLYRGGYRDTTFTFTISPADRAPLTLVLARQRPP